VAGEAADRQESEAAVDVRAPCGRKQPVADDEIPFTFVVAGRTGLEPGRLRRTGRASITSGFVLAVLVEGEVATNRLVQFAVRLERVVVEGGVVRLPIQGEEID